MKDNEADKFMDGLLNKLLDVVESALREMGYIKEWGKDINKLDYKRIEDETEIDRAQMSRIMNRKGDNLTMKNLFKLSKMLNFTWIIKADDIAGLPTTKNINLETLIKDSVMLDRIRDDLKNHYDHEENAKKKLKKQGKIIIKA